VFFFRRICSHFGLKDCTGSANYYRICQLNLIIIIIMYVTE
jgi:hypothetical protein